MFGFQAMNAVIKTWRDGPYIFIVQIGLTTAKDSPARLKRTERTTPSSYQNKLFTSKIALYTVNWKYSTIFMYFQSKYSKVLLVYTIWFNCIRHYLSLHIGRNITTALIRKEVIACVLKILRLFCQFTDGNQEESIPSISILVLGVLFQKCADQCSDFY